LAGTAQGWINVPTSQLSAPTIFNLLQKAGVTWKVYYTDTVPGTGTPGKPDTYISYFSQMMPYMTSNVAPLSQYFTDLTNGTLPQVALIEAGRDSGLDEHPNNNVIVGAKQVQSIINAFLSSSSYQDSVFILTWDEGGGMYDHVPPAATVNPDGIAPNLATDPNVLTIFGDNFTKTGFRVPLIVISPWTIKGYVSHKVADYTAILKFIETRFNLSSLTLRDAAQPDMTDFFDFVNVPNSAPPTPPAQVSGVACYYTSLP
jgi:phospholipase C